MADLSLPFVKVFMFSTVRPSHRFPCARLAPVNRLVLATLLILSTEPVYAEWVAVAMTPNGEMMVYADPNTLRREGELVKWWELNDYDTPQTESSKVGKGDYVSVKVQTEYDCAKELMRHLAISKFTGRMGGGYVVFSSSEATKWIPIRPESIGQIIWKKVCGYEP